MPLRVFVGADNILALVSLKGLQKYKEVKTVEKPMLNLVTHPNGIVGGVHAEERRERNTERGMSA